VEPPTSAITPSRFIAEVLEQRQARLDDSGYPAVPGEPGRFFALENSDGSVQVTLRGMAGKELAATVPVEEFELGPVPETAGGANGANGTNGAEPDPKTKYWALDLLACRLAHKLAVEDGHAFEFARRRIGNGLPTFEKAYAQPELPTVEHSRADPMLQKLQKEYGSVQIYGRTGAGKSKLVSLLAYRCIDEHQIPRIELDLQDPDDGAESVLSAILTLPRPEAGWYLLVVENMHNNSARAQQVFELVDRLRRLYGFRIAVLATSGLSLEKMRERPACLRDVWCVAAEPRQVVNQWARDLRLGPAQKKALLAMSGDGQDITLAKLGLDYFRAKGSIPAAGQFTLYTAEHFGLDKVEDPRLRDCLYEFACLGAAEVEVSASTIRRHRADIVAEFATLIEKADSTYRIGSRSLARELARYAFKHWGMPQHPADIIMNQVRLRGEMLTRQLIGGLDLIDLRRDDAGTTSQVLAGVLKARRRLGDLLAAAVREENGEWRDNAACAAFAAMALHHLERHDDAEKCAEFVRDRWVVEPGVLPIWNGGMKTAEQLDFLGLKDMMQEEDELLAERPGQQGKNYNWPPELRSDQINLDRLHQTWMLGVLLSFEGSMRPPRMDRIDDLYETAKAAWQPDGGFYPRRIPWMTARILIGLCEAGLSDTELARDAANWLLDWREPGEVRPMGWASGTGQWNSLAMTNAMCLIALMKCDLDLENSMLAVGYQHMISAIEAQPGPEDQPIDYAFMIDALLLADRTEDRERAYELIPALLAWISRGDTWQNPRTHRSGLGLRQIKVESTELPFTAAQIVPCVWKMVADKLHEMYKEYIDGPTKNVEPTPPAVLETPVPPPIVQGTEPIPVALLEMASRRLDEIKLAVDENIATRQRTLRQMVPNGHRLSVETSTVQHRLLEFERFKTEENDYRQRFENGRVDKRLIIDIDNLGLRVMPQNYVRVIPAE